MDDDEEPDEAVRFARAPRSEVTRVPAAGGDPGPHGWCVCGRKVPIADALEVTLPNGRPGWEGRCPECGAPLFAIRRKPKHQ